MQGLTEDPIQLQVWAMNLTLRSQSWIRRHTAVFSLGLAMVGTLEQDNAVMAAEASTDHPNVTFANGGRMVRKAQPPAMTRVPIATRGIVLSAGGKPVENADVGLVGIERLVLGKATLLAFGAAREWLTKTDNQGVFTLSPQMAHTIVAVHLQGYGEVTSEEFRRSGKIVLQPWGCVEGTLRIGGQAGPRQQVQLSRAQFQRDDLPYDSNAFVTSTDDQGRFRFDFVPPGPHLLERLIPNGASRVHSHPQSIMVKSGQTIPVTFGGMGRLLIGKVVLADVQRTVNWLQGDHSLVYRLPPKAYKSTDGKQLTSAKYLRYYHVAFATNGTFRIEDVPAGNYDLNVVLTDRLKSGGFETIGSLSREVVVPRMRGGRSDEPLDLGSFSLSLKKP